MFFTHTHKCVRGKDVGTVYVPVEPENGKSFFDLRLLSCALSHRIALRAAAVGPPYDTKKTRKFVFGHLMCHAVLLWGQCRDAMEQRRAHEFINPSSAS